ncbi:vWA domain-containing protein [Candidatus Rariloculus sp.]|uniref:vWA domain-containing protein n=1 Tax=Candidatus Rariloculus sp. TaxID=3101265 RepID=UPI003D09A314
MWTLAWWWMLFALPAPWLVRRLLAPRPLDNDAALTVPAASQFADLAGGAGVSPRRQWRHGLMWMIWVAALLGAARPQFVGEPVALPVSGRDLLLAVDLSGSMEEQDFQLQGQWVDRLTATKSVAEDFIANRVGDRLGLILFGRNAYLQTPLTFDRTTIQTLLDESVIGLAGKETAIGDAIGLGIRTLDDAGVEEGRRVLVILTDGANTAGSVDPLKAAELAAQRGVVVYTIGIGADALTVRSLFGLRQINPSADLDEQTLSSIAELTGGRYFRARDTEELAEIYDLLDELEPAETDEEGFRPVRELFHWPLGLAVAIAALAAALSAVAAHPLVWRGRSRTGAGHG